MKNAGKPNTFRSLIPLLVSQTIVAFNDNAMKAMLPVMAAFQFGKASMDPTNQVVSVMLILPFVVFAPWAGWVADRFSKKKVVGLALIAQILGLGVLAFGLFIQNLTVGLSGFFLLAIQTAFFSPGKKGILKELIGSERLGLAVGWMEMLTMVGILGGIFASASYFDYLVPIHGGWNAGLILSLIAIGLTLFSWILFIRTPSTDAPRAKPFEKNVLWGHWKDLTTMWKDRGLRGAALGDAWFWSIGGFIYLVLVKLAGEVVDGEIGMGQLYGYWFLLLGVGIMLGSLFAAYLNRGRIELGLTPIGAVLLPIAMFIIYQMNPLEAGFEWGCLLLGFSGALFFVPLNGFLQDRSGESERGRILAASNLLTQLSSIIFIFVHAFLSNMLELSAKQEVLVMIIPSCLIALFTLNILLEDFFRALFHIGLRIFYRIQIVGMENFPAKGGVLLVSNHLSYADPVFIGAAFPRKIRYLAWAGLANSRILRQVFRLTHTAVISPERSLETMKMSVNRLKEGVPLCVFAEGGISKLGNILPFKRGILLLARQAGVPILPVHLDGVWGSNFSMERGRFFKKWPISFPYRVCVRVGEVIGAQKTEGESIRSRVMELGRLSFSKRLPDSKMCMNLIQHSIRSSPPSECIRLAGGKLFTRMEVAEFFLSGKKMDRGNEEFYECMNSMLAFFQEVEGAQKIWASYLRIRETHLWDQGGFKINKDSYLKYEWILWAVLLGGFTVEFFQDALEVRRPGGDSKDALQLVNGISTGKNGLISLNFQSLPERAGDCEESEIGHKDGTFGRILPGLSYRSEPKFGVVGIDGVLDQLDFVQGVDADGFLLKG